MNQLNNNRVYFNYVGLFKENPDKAVRLFFNSNDFKSLKMSPHEFMTEYNVIRNLENMEEAFCMFYRYKSTLPDFLSNLFLSILNEMLNNDVYFPKKIISQLKKYSELFESTHPNRNQISRDDLINYFLNGNTSQKSVQKPHVYQLPVKQVNNNNLSEIEKMIDNKLKLFKEEINFNINSKFDQLFCKINELVSKNQSNEDSKKNTNKDGYVDTIFKIIDKVSSNDTIVKMMDNSSKKEEIKKPDLKNTFDAVSSIFNTFKTVNDFGKSNNDNNQKSLVEDYTSKILDSCKKNIVENTQNTQTNTTAETLSSLLNSFSTNDSCKKHNNENISPTVNAVLDIISKLTGNGIDIDIKFDDKKSEDLIDLNNVTTKNEPMVPPSSPLFDENVDDLNVIYDN